MVTTEELIKMAEKESAEIGKAEKEISDAEKLAMIKWDLKLAKEKEESVRQQKIRKGIYEPAGSLGKLKSGSGGKIVKKIFAKVASEYKKSQKPIKVKRRPIPTQLRPKRKVLRQPRNIPIPQSVRELQGIRNLRYLLTQQEQMEVDRIFSGSQRAAAMAILRRRLKEQQVARIRANPRTITQVDPFNSNRIIQKKKVPTERWLM